MPDAAWAISRLPLSLSWVTESSRFRHRFAYARLLESHRTQFLPCPLFNAHYSVFFLHSSLRRFETCPGMPILECHPPAQFAASCLNHLFERAQIALGAFKGKETDRQRIPRHIIDGGHQTTGDGLDQTKDGDSHPKAPSIF
jgi:hypothetical protein